MVKEKMVGPSIILPAKWEQLLKKMAEDHNVDLSAVVSQLCEWAFSEAEGIEQFGLWLDEAYPEEGETEDEARALGEEAAEEEEETEEDSEEESHEHRD
jgi:hypothetical protein